MRALLAVAVLLAGCSTTVTGVPVRPTDQELVAGYFQALNDSAGQGPTAQLEFLKRTQHPDFTNLLCDLGGVTINAKPGMSTFEPDPEWSPQSGGRPRGTVYVVAVSLTVRQNGRVLGAQIGSERVVVLDGGVYGFMPCLR
jgi:hypothetical protein